MEKLSLRKLQSLIHEDTAPCVTLYVPVNQLEMESERQGIYKTLLLNAEKLLATQYEDSEVKKMMAPLKKLNLSLIDLEKNSTLVIFKSSTVEGYWVHPSNLPGLSVVSNTFHLKPIIENFMPMQDFFVLSLGSDHAHLYYGTKKVFELVHTFEVDYEKGYENLSMFPQKGLRVFQALEKFLLSSGFKFKDFFSEPFKKKLYDQIDSQVRRFLKAKNVPLIIAGSMGDKTRYRSVNTCFQLKRGSIPFVIQPLDTAMLSYAHSAAKVISGIHYDNLKRKEIARLRKSEKNGKAIYGLDSVFISLCDHKVDTLFVNRAEFVWGHVDWNKRLFTLHPYQLDSKDDDLVDDFIEKGLELGVKIIIVDHDPRFKEHPVAAILKSEQETIPVEKKLQGYSQNYDFAQIGKVAIYKAHMNEVAK